MSCPNEVQAESDYVTQVTGTITDAFQAQVGSGTPFGPTVETGDDGKMKITVAGFNVTPVGAKVKIFKLVNDEWVEVDCATIIA
jgi:hypothetical protein